MVVVAEHVVGPFERQRVERKRKQLVVRVGRPERRQKIQVHRSRGGGRAQARAGADQKTVDARVLGQKKRQRWRRPLAQRPIGARRAQVLGQPRVEPQVAEHGRREKVAPRVGRRAFAPNKHHSPSKVFHAGAVREKVARVFVHQPEQFGRVFGHVHAVKVCVGRRIGCAIRQMLIVRLWRYRCLSSSVCTSVGTRVLFDWFSMLLIL